MFTVDIQFKTEKEDIHLTRGKFTTSDEAVSFAVDFIKPYIMECKVADGEWTVFDPENPSLTERRFQIKSLLSMRKEEPVNRL